MSERLYCRARRAETAQGSVARSQDSALSLHEVNENLLLALAEMALKLIKRHADVCAGRAHHNKRDTTAYMHEQKPCLFMALALFCTVPLSIPL